MKTSIPSAKSTDMKECYKKFLFWKWTNHEWIDKDIFMRKKQIGDKNAYLHKCILRTITETWVKQKCKKCKEVRFYIEEREIKTTRFI